MVSFTDVQEALAAASVQRSFAHNSSKRSYLPFNLQLQPLTSQHAGLCSLGSGPILQTGAHMQCTYLYTEFITVLEVLIYPCFSTRQYTTADKGRDLPFHSLTLLHNLSLVKSCWKKVNDLVLCFVFSLSHFTMNSVQIF